MTSNPSVLLLWSEGSAAVLVPFHFNEYLSLTCASRVKNSLIRPVSKLLIASRICSSLRDTQEALVHWKERGRELVKAFPRSPSTLCFRALHLLNKELFNSFFFFFFTFDNLYCTHTCSPPFFSLFLDRIPL